ncbi:hypothetical protein K2173_011702 [Erythroxylum novogranatense]|uniref:PWWP domain-containing protein n=1 Tax=Erythroxylum novogranatense TaxID=1862640 RepID=A0AAV8T209_9ROSI|nr:hypothetical protein K2173_011702 [Erythroxylum novogranatense]
MDEHKENGISVSDTSKESKTEKVREDVDEVVDGEKTRLDAPVSSDAQEQGQVEESTEEEVVVVNRGSCNGADIMVGVMGSDTYVDSVCIRDSADGGGGNSSGEAANDGDGSTEMGLEREVKDLEGGSALVGELGAEVIKDSRADVVNVGTDVEIGCSSRAEESKGGELVGDLLNGELASDVGGGGKTDDKSSQKIEIDNVERQPGRMEGIVETSSLNEGDTQVQAEEVVVVSTVEALEGKLGKEGAESCSVNVVEGVGSGNLGVSESEGQNGTVENEGGGASMSLDCSVVETRAVVEEMPELVDKPSERAMEVDGVGENPVEESKKQEAHVLCGESRDTGTKIADPTSANVVEDSNVAYAVGEEEGVLVKTEASNTHAEEPSSNALEDTLIKDDPASTSSNALEDTLIKDDPASTNSILQDKIYCPKRDSVSKEKDDIDNAPSKPLEDQAQTTIESKLGLVDSQEITCPNIEGMDNDVFHGNFYFSVEELQGMVETCNESTENRCNAFADSQNSFQATQILGGEATPTMGNVLLSSEMNSDFAKVEEGIGVDRKVNDPGQAGLLREGKTIITEQRVEVDDANGTTQTEGCTYMHPTTSCHSTQVLGEEVKQTDCEVSLNRVHISNFPLGTVQHPKTQTMYEGFPEHITLAEEGRDEKKIGEQKPTVCVSTEPGTQVTNRDDQQLKVEEGLNESAFQTDSAVLQEMLVEEPAVDTEQIPSHEEEEMDTDEEDTDNGQSKTVEDASVKRAALKSGSTRETYEARYELPVYDDTKLSEGDLVWGKVRSHPWWPGQIFDPTDASEKAMKYHKKDCFLVAYFGDRTFAWNEASLLKPFRSSFSLVEKQGTSEAFQKAVNCALEEVARRTELGLACSCIPKDAYEKIQYQVVENAGIREESSTRDSVDKFTSCDLFESNKLLKYMKALAQCSTDGADRLELVIAKSQLHAFYCLKGYTELLEFQDCGNLLESADGLEFQDDMVEYSPHGSRDDGQSNSNKKILQTQRGSYHKRKHNLKESVYPRKKERSMSELMGDSWDSVGNEIGSEEKSDNRSLSPSSSKKHMSFHTDSATPEGRRIISLAKVSTTIASPKPSFKIGDCIRRVASQMAGSPSILKCNAQKGDGNSDGVIGDVSDASAQHYEDAETKATISSGEYSSLDELVSQLHLVAQDPLKGYNFLSIVVGFFSDFRNSLIVDQPDKVIGKRRKTCKIGGSPETFEFEDLSDTYWTDRFIHNNSEEQPSRKSRKRTDQFGPMDSDKPFRRSNSRKHYSDGKPDLSADKPTGYIDEMAPAELVMHFPVVDSVPSETNLNKMFRRFGPLKESETEVDRDTNRARVVYKRSSDAQAAYGSATKFNIFGSVLVNYQLNYTISVPFKTIPIATSQGVDDVTMFLEF